MADRPIPEEERFRLLSAWCDGTISDAQVEQLDGLLRIDPEFRKFFLAYLDQHALLAAEVLPMEQPLRPLGDEPAAVGELADNVETPADEVPIQSFAREPRRIGYLGWTLFGLAAAVLLALGMLFFVRSRVVRDEPVVTQAYPKVDFDNGLAMVVNLEGVRWEPGDGPHPSTGDVLPSGRFRLRSGRATLSLFSGVVLVVEGPADLDLVSIDRVFCRSGRLRTRVPKGAEGFVVSSPRSAVMDLGTEFEIDVGGDGKARVHVNEGQTEGAVLSKAGILQRSQRMVPDEVFEINPVTGKIATLAVSGPKTIVKPAELVAPALVLDPSYPRIVLASKPWSYWRFESLADGVTPNEVPGRPTLRAHGPIRLTETDTPDAIAGANHSAVFQAGQTGHYFAMDGAWTPPRDPGYALELWFLPEVISHATLAILYVPMERVVDDRHFKHLFFTELTASTRQTMFPPGAVRFLHRWPPGPEGGDNLFSNDRYVPYRWHHLVVQLNGDLMELFLDGVPNETLPVYLDDTNTECRFLLGRLTTEPKHSFFTSRPFVGRMDEVALYGHPLTAEEVRRHYQLATHRNRPR
jgi:hypothetical protein